MENHQEETHESTTAGPQNGEMNPAEAEANPDQEAPDAQRDDASGAAPAADPDPAAEVEKWRDMALRCQAELENFRKRMSREVAESRRFAAADLIEDLLPLLDNFDFGLQAAFADGADSPIATGMSMVRRQFDDFLSNHGVKEVEGAGQVFDPTRHEAVSTEASDEIPEGTIMRVVRRGFFLHDRVLRAPSVVVSSGPEAAKPQS